MRLVPGQDGDWDDGLDIDMDDINDQELEAIAYRVTQVVWDRCEEIASKLAHSGMNHPVVFICDVGDPFGWEIAIKITSSELVSQAMRETPFEIRPGVIGGIEMEEF